MGERLRLRKDFDTSNYSPEVETILVALQEYGMFVADNGIDWAISVTPDPRIPVLHDELRKIKGSDFEVVSPPAGYKKPRRAGRMSRLAVALRVTNANPRQSRGLSGQSRD